MSRVVIPLWRDYYPIGALVAKPLKFGLSENLIVELPPKPKNKIFVICPVRNVKPKINKKIAAHVAKLEAEGHEIYWPYRDNPYQKTDSVGTQIIAFNRVLMCRADEVHIWYEKTSTGSIFDIGMFFALVYNNFKKFVIINRENVVPTPSESFENILLALEKYFDNPVANGLKERWDKYGK